MQVFGRLPFDDSNHKRLLKQIHSPVTFPPRPEVSDVCKMLILKMVMRCEDRIPLTCIAFEKSYKSFTGLNNPAPPIAKAIENAPTLKSLSDDE